jgi:class 3 adenylate cyclase
MAQQIEKLAVMFADICESTALYERVGDAQARQLISWCITTMLHEIIPFQGVLIKTIGDEIMSTFPSAEAAFNAACAMQNAVRNKQPKNGMVMHVRIGFHYGDVICEAGDVFGDTVNVAARVAGLARADQIMTTQAVQNALPPMLQNETYQIMSAELKGKQEKYPIFLAIWENDDKETTRFNATLQRQLEENAHELTLSYNGQQFKINADCKSIMLGRGDDCDIIIRNSVISRLHVRVEFRFGKFLIVDQSTNGTYVRFSDGHVAHITREEMILQGAGRFSLGQSSFENANEFIEFSIDLDSRRF